MDSGGIQFKRGVSGEGPEDAKIVILTDFPTYEDWRAGRPLSDFQGHLLFDQFRKAGLKRADVRVESISEDFAEGRGFGALSALEQSAWKGDAHSRLEKLKPNVIVPLGEHALELVTGKHSIDKWHCSILSNPWGVKVVPLYHPRQILRSYSDIFFLALGAQRIAKQAKFPEMPKIARNYVTSPDTLFALEELRKLEQAEYLSLDIETRQGQTVCVGFTSDGINAICVPVLPNDDTDPKAFYELWCAVARVCAGPSKKILQNQIYDTTFLSKYGVRVRNVWHDTMTCQKFLYPELPMGLDTIARIHTERPYWKDDAKDWSIRQNITALYEYNCEDVCGTFEAAFSQRADLKQRGLEEKYQRLVQSFSPIVSEMCWTGLRVDVQEKERLKEETRQSITRLMTTFDEDVKRVMGPEGKVNPRSPLQVKNLLRAAKLRIPVKHGKETSDKGALMKLRLKHPDVPFLTPLIKLSEEQKKLSSYLSYAYDTDGRMRYTLNIHGTTPGRWSGYQDPWDNGVNPQTIPAELKGMFIASEGFVLVEIDLAQADARVVAWSAPEPTLIEMFNAKKDIHRWVAGRIFKIAEDVVTKDQRQLGKKSGHASNYGTHEKTFAEACLKEMDLVLTENEARSILEGYHEHLPGIRRWQRKIREDVTRNRMLKTPFGRERVFYGRLGDDLFREAYAYVPPSVVVDVINTLVKHVWETRRANEVRLLLQIHDSALVEVRENTVEEFVKDVSAQHWNPTISGLPGGPLKIPIEIKTGTRWSEMKGVFTG